jgi:hypothetical protein
MAGDRMPWFKWWGGTAADMKFRMVAEDCKLPVACIVGAWAYVLEHASKNEPRGSMEGLDLELMAYTLQLPDPETVCNAMKRRKLLDEDGNVTKWEDRQGKRERNEAPGSSTERVQRMRARKKAEKEAQQNKGLGDAGAAGGDGGQGGNGETHVTPGNATKHPKKKKEREKESKPKTLTPSSAGAAGEGGEDDPGEPEPEKVKPFDQFWAAYPRRQGKADAHKAWTKLKIDNDTVLQALILNAIEKQKDGADWRKDDGQFIPHPATWLRAGRWLDEVRPYTAPAPKLPPNWWADPDSMKAAGLMLDPPLTPRQGEGQKAFVLRIRVALGEVDMPTDQARDYTMTPIPEKLERPYIPPTVPEGVQLTPEQLDARKQEMREQLAKLKQTGNLALAGLAAANTADKAA